MKIAVNADYIVDFDMNCLKNGWILYDEKNVQFLNQIPEGNNIRKIYLKNRLIIPPLVNAHTHLELTLTKFNPERVESFENWLLWIISNRQKLDIEEIKKGLKTGINLSKKWGTGFIGDISSYGISSENFIERGTIFHEIIGNKFPKNIKFPISIHAIYSTSAETIREGASLSRDKGLPFQMHIGESFQEQLFAQGKENCFEKRIYPTIGRERFEHLTTENVVKYLEKCDAISEELIAVHCTNLSKKELEKLMEKKAGIVICPKSNIFLKTGLPDIEFLSSYEKVGIGTDGLSSNCSLSVLSEIKTIYFMTEGKIPLKKLLYMATTGGAKALKLEKKYRKSGIFTSISSTFKVSDPFKLLLMDDISIDLFDLNNLKC